MRRLLLLMSSLSLLLACTEVGLNDRYYACQSDADCVGGRRCLYPSSGAATENLADSLRETSRKESAGRFYVPPAPRPTKTLTLQPLPAAWSPLRSMR